MKKITPFLWFDNNLQEAVDFYSSVFKNATIGYANTYGKQGPRPEGTLMTASFNLEGQEFMGLNGGPHFKFTEAISFFINCDSQDEIDHYWEKLIRRGTKIALWLAEG